MLSPKFDRLHGFSWMAETLRELLSAYRTFVTCLPILTGYVVWIVISNISKDAVIVSGELKETMTSILAGEWLANHPKIQDMML